MAKRTKRAAAVAVWSPLLLLLAACAARQATGARAPAEPVGAAPTTIDDAQRDIAHWRAVLGVGQAQRPATPAPSPLPSAVQPQEEPPPPAQPSGGVPTEKDELSSGAAACATPCHAIASMRRSVGVLCRLAGDDDDRCKDARQVLTESEQRVAPCGC